MSLTLELIMYIMQSMVWVAEIREIIRKPFFHHNYAWFGYLIVPSAA